MNPTTNNKIASTNPIQNVATQGTKTAAGIVNFDPNTGAKLQTGQSVVVNQGGNTYGSKPYSSQSTTTLSSDKTGDILNNNNKLTTLAQKGVQTDPNSGVATTADGAVYTPPITYVDQAFADSHDMSAPIYQNYRVKPATPTGSVDPYDTSKETAEIDTKLAEMKAGMDAVTASQITSIQERYKRLKEQQTKINESTLGATTNALIQSGAAKHDVYSDDSIKLRMDQNLEKMKDLDAEENDLINTAKAAQLANNNKLLEYKIAQIEKVREQKQAAASKLNEELIEANKLARTQQEQIQKDSAVADVFSMGITSPAEILKELNSKGYNITSKEVAETLKNIQTSVPGLEDLVKTLAQNGAPQEIIQKVLNSGNINEAYANAGSYAAGGSGIVGEYNFYKSQAEQAGQVPMSFNDYQNVDANRKKSIAAAGIANQYGLDKEQRNRVAGLLDDYDKQAKDKKTVVSQSSQIVALSPLALSTNKDKGSRAAAQIGTIFSFMKMLDPTSTVREGEYATAQNTAGVEDKIRNAYNKALDGSFLTDGQIKGYVSTGKALAESNRRQLEDIDKEFDRRSAIFGIPAGTIAKTGEVTKDQSLIQTEDQAKSAILDYGKTNTKAQTQIRQMVKDGVPYLQIKEVLNIP